MEKVINFFDKRFVKYWLLHAFALWLFFAITTTGNYINHLYFRGDYNIQNVDRAPMTVFQYFLSNDIHWVIIITFLIIAFFLEINYRWVVDRKSVV